MENILLERLKGVSLTKGQEKIASYVIENQYLICQKTLMELSKEIGVSDASILRFVRTIGFEGYNEFKSVLYTNLIAQRGALPKRGDLNLGQRNRDSSSLREVDIFQQTIKNALNVAERSLTQNTRQSYEKIAESILQSQHIYVFGTRGTKGLSEHFARALSHIKSNVITLNHAYDVYPMLGGASPNDIFIFFCASRFYKSDVRLCQAAKDKGLTICLITDTIPSPISQFANQLLLVCIDSISYYNSMIGYTAVCEYIITLVCHQNENYAQTRLDEIGIYNPDELCSPLSIEDQQEY